MLPTNQSVTWTKNHSFLAKWNILFEKSNDWILFKPNPGVKFYACYSCKNLFLSKIAFQDHINRRVIRIKYKCKDCLNLFTFFNRCSFLLHTRKHYNINEGEINLTNLDIFILTDELIGFHYHEYIPYLYSDDEEYITDDTIINTNFYMPDENDMGKQIIHMKAHKLIFHNDSKSLTLKQITSNIPLCEIIIHTPAGLTTTTTITTTIATPKKRPIQRRLIEIDNNNSIDSNLLPTEEQEPNQDDLIISKIESLTEIALVKKSPICTECSKPITNKTIALHFTNNNKPYDENLYCIVCKYIAPTKCSLSAHKRIHTNLPPFVCPECGRNFPNSYRLTTHIDDVCFHAAKRIRYRCPGMKCGKIFVVRNTFATHFANHIQCIQHCNICNVAFMKDTDFQEHCKIHNDDGTCKPVKSYNCLVCKNHPIITLDNYEEHIKLHVYDRERCIYIYRCKICHSYFRTVTTYGSHIQRFHKSTTPPPTTTKPQTSLISTNCTYCKYRIVFRDREKDKSCTVCKQVNYNPEIVVKQDDENPSICVLCKDEIVDNDVETHYEICKYKNPIVPIQNVEAKLSETDSDNEATSDYEKRKQHQQQQQQQQVTLHKRKKRKRSNNSNKSTSSSSTLTQKNDNHSELNIDRIDDTDDYHCKLCDFQHNDRKQFHTHIIKHRDVSTAYQCMECGECFVVKPSLLKHLVLYHKITDTDTYLSNNDCFDRNAIEQLETNRKLLPGEHQGPVKQNQCSVCLMQCDSVIALNKHFRTHGMAFLLKKGH